MADYAFPAVAILVIALTILIIKWWHKRFKNKIKS